MPSTPRQLPHEARPTEADLDAAFPEHEPVGDKQLHDKTQFRAEELERLRRQIIMVSSDGPTVTEIPRRNVDTQLAAFQAEWPKIEASETAKVTAKEGKQGYSYQYAGLDLVAGKVSPLLGKHGLAFSAQPTIGPDGRSLVLQYQLRHGESGTMIEGVLPLPANPANPQVLGSMITYFRRYALLSVTNTFPGGEDDDGSAAKAHDDRERMYRREYEKQTRAEMPALRDSVNRAQQKQNRPVSAPPARPAPEPVVDEAGDEPPNKLPLGDVAIMLRGVDTDPAAGLFMAAEEYASLSDEELDTEISPADTASEPAVHGRTPRALFAERIKIATAAAHRMDQLDHVARSVNRAALPLPTYLIDKRSALLAQKGTPE